MERERAVVTLNSIGDAVLCTDISGDITYLNLVAETMTGWYRQDAIGKPFAEVFQIVDGATRKTARDPMEMAVEQNKTSALPGLLRIFLFKSKFRSNSLRRATGNRTLHFVKYLLLIIIAIHATIRAW